MFLYQDYIQLPERLLTSIIRNNPNANGFGPYSDQDILNCFDIFHSIEEPIFLKSNRLHFWLDLIYTRYKCKIIHVIRHPLDVWLSIKKAPKRTHGASTNSIFNKLYIYLKINFGLGRTYEINKQFRWINHKVGLPFALPNNLLKKLLVNMHPFEKFVINWTISNYFAILSLESFKGTLITYEDIISHPELLQKMLNKHIDLDIKNPPQVLKNNFFKYSEKDLKHFNKVIQKYKLEHQINYILNAMEIAL